MGVKTFPEQKSAYILSWDTQFSELGDHITLFHSRGTWPDTAWGNGAPDKGSKKGVQICLMKIFI